MSFSAEKPIYLQLAERMEDDILSGTYRSDERIPSVREYAVLLEVNINTAVKAYELLARDGVIYNRRGLGYFVSPEAREVIVSRRRHLFITETLPRTFRNMDLLGITIEEINLQWHNRKL